MGMTTRNPAPLKRGLVGLVVIASAALALTTATSNGTRNQTAMEKSLLSGSNVPVPVREVLQRACQDCHSENTKWPWYSHMPPISWHIHSDVEKGRAFMDLTKWNDYTDGERQGYMAVIAAVVRNHLMPPSQYVWMHPEARLSGDELALIRAWASRSLRQPDAN
jgi:hypothetical protein